MADYPEMQETCTAMTCFPQDRFRGLRRSGHRATVASCSSPVFCASPASAGTECCWIMPAPVLEVAAVTKKFGAFAAVEDVTFTVGQGSICALLGINGAGKTTLLKCIIGLIPTDEGTIRCPARQGFARQDWFSYVPEESGLYERMRVEETILYFAQLSGMAKADARRAMEPWLEKLKLAPKRRSRISELSKGNQQKVKLISALINHPPLLILDEPFTGLDGEGSALLRESLIQIRKEGTTILLSSHRLDQMDLLADHVVVLAAGRKILDSTLSEARQVYRQNLIEVSFTSAPPSLDGLPGVVDLRWEEGVAQLTLGPGANPKEILTTLLARGCEVENFMRHSPDLSEIFHAVTR
jgi:ABC-2 type transport system ATP-binding protein